MLKRIVKWNINFANRRLLPHALFESRAYAIYYWVGLAHLLDPAVRVIVDVGAGRTWYFGEDVKAKRDVKLIGIDDNAGEMASNPSLDERVVCDASKTLGVADGSVDLIFSRAAVEHLPDNEGFIRACNRALAPGGRVVLVFTGKWAPPSIINRLLPHRLVVAALRLFVPSSEGYQGFYAYYDKCSDTEFTKVLEDNGFEVEYRYQSYFASAYYMFFIPLYLASLVLDYLRMMISVRDLATMHLYVARKRSQCEPSISDRLDGAALAACDDRTMERRG